ncbi:MAG TPA: SxtJ family membrane protein [Anaerolineales bacterium]|nr:SxtJ family membrane protein [Anaerolineales bacterium]
MSEFSAKTEIKMGSERSFGLVFATVFLIVSLFPLTGDGTVRIWALALAGAFAVAAFLAPDFLRPLNRLWFRLGLVLNKIVSPIVMGIIFFLTVTPIGLIRRARNSDPLKQKIDPDAETYWIAVDPEHVARSSMKKQF